MNHKSIMFLLLLLVIFGVPRVWGDKESQQAAQQTAGADYKGNNCVSCHSRLLEPLHVGNRYLEWQFSAHQAKGVGCEKCHGGDPTTGDKDKAHIGVLAQADGKSRINWRNQTQTCGVCHEDEVNAFKQSAHFQKNKDGGIGPSCINCHAHMATRVIYDSKETANLCARCHDAPNFMQTRPDIPLRAGETVMALQRAVQVISWAQLLIDHGQTMGLELDSQKSELKLPQQLLREAKVKWHTFDLDATRKQADEAFLKGSRVKDELRKKLTTE